MWKIQEQNNLSNNFEMAQLKEPVFFLSWPGCRWVVKRLGLKEGKKMDDPHYLQQGGKREWHVCWVIHRLTLSLPGFLPSCCICSPKPLITKSFLVQYWCLTLPNPCLVIVLVLPALIQQTFTKEHNRFLVVSVLDCLWLFIFIGRMIIVVFSFLYDPATYSIGVYLYCKWIF